MNKSERRTAWVKTHSKLWIEANEKLAIIKQKRLIASRKSVSTLSDMYIRKKLRTNMTIKIKIPQELIEVKRLQMLIKRRLKDENNNRTT